GRMLQLEAAVAIGAPVVELHTGAYANACDAAEREQRLAEINAAAEGGRARGLVINAGHGLDYDNVRPIAANPLFHELNIGHAIVARALFTGLPEAVSHMRGLMDAARQGLPAGQYPV
ncbi:MAG: pyridoxine 5'-phosphate synthase, partial [Thioalkalivibrio sp.]|nr:pyridoxine 5'-phosphate synthase [Thioalkalivibrio sp.]